jgi:hypothetical protein
MNSSKQTDLMAMDVTWSLEDLELYDYQIGVGEATIFTISKTIVLAMGMIAQRTFYKMMKRLPGRVINKILYLHMVRATYLHTTKVTRGRSSAPRFVTSS